MSIQITESTRLRLWAAVWLVVASGGSISTFILTNYPADKHPVAKGIAVFFGILGLIGVGGQGLSKPLFHTEGNPEKGPGRGPGLPLASVLLACLLVGLPLTQTACGDAGLRWAKDRTADVSTALATAPALVDAFAASALLTGEEARAWQGSIERLRLAYDPLSEAVEKLERFDATAALYLLPLAEDFVKQLDAERLIKLPANPTVARRYAEARAILDAFAAVFLSRLNAKLRGAKTSSFGDWRLKRRVESDCGRLKELLTVNG